MTSKNSGPSLPMVHVDISRISSAWMADDGAIVDICALTLQHSGKLAAQCSDYEISVVLADDAFVRTLNAAYRGKDKPSNVLSFPQGVQGESGDRVEDDAHAAMLGDIVLAYETIAREATEQNKSFADHFLHLLVHGLLHLLGYDHEDDAEAKAMEEKEIYILSLRGIKNPYADGFSVQ